MRVPKNSLYLPFTMEISETGSYNKTPLSELAKSDLI
jgi:hypothetical protein